jgi:hypothetical protein
VSGSLAFNGSGDALTVSLGAANVTAAFTWALVVKPTNPTAGGSNAVTDSADGFNHYIKDDASDAIAWWNGSVEHHNTGILSTDATWQVQVIRKAAGSATPVFSKVLLTTGVASHGNSGGGAAANKSATTSYRIGGTLFVGLVACMAIAKTNFSDAAVAALLNFAAFRSAGFDEIWKLDGSAAFNGSGTSTQTTLTGTTHSTDEPAGFWGTPDVIIPTGVS